MDAPDGLEGGVASGLTARLRLQSLDDRLRELEQRYAASKLSSAGRPHDQAAGSLTQLPAAGSDALILGARPANTASHAPELQRLLQPHPAPAQPRNPSPLPEQLWPGSSGTGAPTPFAAAVEPAIPRDPSPSGVLGRDAHTRLSATLFPATVPAPSRDPSPAFDPSGYVGRGMLLQPQPALAMDHALSAPAPRSDPSPAPASGVHSARSATVHPPLLQASKPALASRDPSPGNAAYGNRGPNAQPLRAFAPGSAAGTNVLSAVAATSSALPETRGPAGTQQAIGTQPATTYAEVPLRQYPEGLPHKALGPPQSTWESDKNKALLALSDQVHALEGQLAQQAAAAAPATGEAPGQPPAVMPPPSYALMPVPLNTHGCVAVHVPAPVKYYPAVLPGGVPPPGPAAGAGQAIQGRRTAPQPRAPPADPDGGRTAHAASAAAARRQAQAAAAELQQQQQENVPPQQADGSSNMVTPESGSVFVAAAAATAPPSMQGAAGRAWAAPLAASAAASIATAALRDATERHPAGPYPVVSALLAAGESGGQPGAWEQAKMRALLSLEQDKAVLERQLASFRDIEARHRRQLLDLADKHRKDLRDAAGVAGQKLEHLMQTAWRTYLYRWTALRITRILHRWRRITMHSKRLAWAQKVWRRRSLELAFVQWHMLAMAHRRARAARKRAAERWRLTLLHAWAAQAAYLKRLEQMRAKCQLLRTGRLLLTWLVRARELAGKRRRLEAAARHACAVLVRRGWRGLAANLERERADEQALVRRVQRSTKLLAFQAWARHTLFVRKLMRLHRKAVLRAVVRSWQAFAAAASVRRRKVVALRAEWRLRRLALFVYAWHRASVRLGRLWRAGQALAAAVRGYRLAMGLSTLRLAALERKWSGLRARYVLRAWHAVSARRARNGRVAAAKLLARRRALRAATFDSWRVVAMGSKVVLHLQEIHRLQEMGPEYEAQMELVRQDRAAVQSHMAAVAEENRSLRAEMLRGLVLASEGGLLGKPLAWRSLPADADQWCPEPRSRHSTLLLRGLQAVRPSQYMLHQRYSSAAGGSPGPAVTASLTASHVGSITASMIGGPGVVQHLSDIGGVVPDLSGTLVVFGGIHEDRWLRDLHALVVTVSDGGGTRFDWQLVQPEEKLPLPTRRDHACCVTGPNQFVVVGGFDGHTELMDVHAIEVYASEAAPSMLLHEHHTVEARNRSPPGRSHHSVEYHDRGRSLYVFGGYSSARGHLGELLAFNLDHKEWWEPETTGDQPPPRRNHVSAMIGGKLFIHGGYNGEECLQDTWVLDTATWHWERLHTVGPAPSPRRGHAAEVVDGRYVVVQGGYDGRAYLADAHVLDTRTNTWWALDVEGAPEEMPAPRAHHTLTLMGHALVVLGGSGPLGPLPDVYMLESPALSGALAQAQKLIATTALLVQVQGAMADREAALAVMRHRAEASEHALQLLRDRSGELLSRHNAALSGIEQLKARLVAEQRRVASAEAAIADSSLEVAKLQRRLQRTRQGGQEVVSAAQDMHETLCDLREEVADLRVRLQAATLGQQRGQTSVLQLGAEKQLLQQQLAGAQQEMALLRGMLATSESEFRQALDRQRSAMQADLDATRQQLHDAQMAVNSALTSSRQPAAGGAGDGAEAPAGSGVAHAHAATSFDLELVSLQQLAVAVARAETAELRVHALERDVATVQAELGTVRRQLQHQRLAKEAAEARAEMAMDHMRQMEVRYQMQVEELQRQLVAQQRARWREDLGLPPREDAAAATQQQPAPGSQPVHAAAAAAGQAAAEPQGQSSLQQQATAAMPAGGRMAQLQPEQPGPAQVHSRPAGQAQPQPPPVGSGDPHVVPGGMRVPQPALEGLGHSQQMLPHLAQHMGPGGAQGVGTDLGAAPQAAVAVGGHYQPQPGAATSALPFASEDGSATPYAGGQAFAGEHGPMPSMLAPAEVSRQQQQPMDDAGRLSAAFGPGGVASGRQPGLFPPPPVYTIGLAQQDVVAGDLHVLPEVARLLQLHRDLLDDGDAPRP